MVSEAGVAREGAVATEVWLAVETSTPSGSVAIWKDGLAYEETQGISGVHSERVLPSIARAMDVVGVQPDEVTSLVVGSGPGSFTGVRIAASLAKGWVGARGTPLFTYSSLLAVAAGAVAGRTLCAMFDARRGEVYAACYTIGADGYTTDIDPAAWDVRRLLDEIAKRGIDPAFAGDGATRNRAVIADAFGLERVLPEHLGFPRAASLLWLRAVAPQVGRVERPGEWTPLYVREWRVQEDRG
jgi:tRNA threonylcarbamoyladenosine biosynthesis protein TsaB